MSLELARGARPRAPLPEGLAWSDVVAGLPGPVMIFDRDGQNVFASDTFQRYAGRTPAELSGQGWLRSVHGDDLDRIRRAWRAAVEAGEAFEEECRLIRHDGEVRWFACRVAPLFGAGRQPLAWVGMGLDVQERKLNEIRLALALEAAELGEWSFEPVGGDVRLSERAAEVFGVDVRLIPWAELRARIHEDDIEALIDSIRSAMRDGRSFSMAYRVRQADGRMVWVRGRGIGLLGPDGEPQGLIGIVEDTSREKAAEEAERLRLREVDHRAKNLLMVVQALIRLTPFASREEYVGSLIERVDALARSFELTARSSWRGVRLMDLVLDELVAFSREGQHHVSGPEVVVADASVQPLTMIVHELCTNAAKYGALASPEGQLQIGWVVSSTGELVLRWDEHGSAASLQAPPSQGFGSVLLERSAAQLDGRLSRHWRPDGLSVTLTVGASHLSSRSAPQDG